MIKYRIELWNHVTNRYMIAWEGSNLLMAQKMINKPYYVSHARRLVKIEETIIIKETSRNYWSGLKLSKEKH